MGHNHNHAIPDAEHNEKRLKIVLALTGSFLIAEIVGGIITDSLALLSDAAHMLTDVMALVIALLAIKIGKRGADARRTYGYKRFEILAAALNAVVLLFVGIYILYEAYQRFQSPPEIQSGGMLIIAAIGLVVNIISMSLLAGSQEHSLNMKGAYLEVLSDTVGSVGVIIAALVIRYTGWWQVDPILAVPIGLWVMPRTWKLLMESINILLEGVPEGVVLNDIVSEITKIPNVVEVHDLHVWAITTGQNSLTAHIVVATPQTDNAILLKAQEVAEKHGIHHTNFQLEIEDKTNPVHVIKH